MKKFDANWSFCREILTFASDNEPEIMRLNREIELFRVGNWARLNEINITRDFI